jgi:hypothetical protein
VKSLRSGETTVVRTMPATGTTTALLVALSRRRSQHP